MGVEVCSVHNIEFKGSYFSNIHVVSMAETRPLKRKHPEDSEDEDPPSGCANPASSHIQKMREMLDITYEKLKKTPSLSRFVLMTNIIRSIKRDMERDGIQLVNRDSNLPEWAATNDPLDSPPAAAQPENFHHPYTSDDPNARPPTPVPSTSNNSSFLPITNYPSDFERCLMEIDSPRATPFLKSGNNTPSCVEPPGALWTEESDRLSSLNWSSVLKSGSLECPNGGVNGDFPLSEDGSSATSLHVLMPAITSMDTCLNSLGVYATTNSPSSSSSSPSASPNNASSSSTSGSTSPLSGTSPTSSEDEIFGDVDLALYDYDYTPLSPPNVAMAPLSAEELMWSLSHNEQRVEST